MMHRIRSAWRRRRQLPLPNVPTEDCFQREGEGILSNNQHNINMITIFTASPLSHLIINILFHPGHAFMIEYLHPSSQIPSFVFLHVIW